MVVADARLVDLAAKRDRAEPGRVLRRYRAFMGSGIDIANGGAGPLPGEDAAATRAA